PARGGVRAQSVRPGSLPGPGPAGGRGPGRRRRTSARSPPRGSSRRRRCGARTPAAGTAGAPAGTAPLSCALPSRRPADALAPLEEVVDLLLRRPLLRPLAEEAQDRDGLLEAWVAPSRPLLGRGHPGDDAPNDDRVRGRGEALLGR